MRIYANSGCLVPFCPVRRQTGNYPETGLEYINANLLEADFWPGMTSGVPVIRPKLANTDPDGDLEPLWL